MGPVRTVAVKLVAEISNFKSKLGEAGGSVKTFGAGLDQLAKDSPAKFNGIVRGTAAVGVGLFAAAGAAVKFNSDFDKAMSGVSAATHAGVKDLGQLRDAALKAGADTQFSATEAAQGITELAKAGVSTSAILRGGLAGALDLAAAGQLEVAEAAETAATAMTQFKLSGNQIPHLADLLAAGAGKAQGSVHDLGMALSMGGLVASQFGLSVEDTVGTLAAFAHAGLIGSDSGTSFKAMLLHLAAPAKQTAELMAKLGINAYDAQGNFVGIVKLAGILQDKLGGLTQAERDFALAQIFGTDAIRGANVLFEQGSSGIQEWINKTNDAGYAADTAARLTDNLTGDIERLTGSLDTLANQSGTGANAGLRKLVGTAEDLVDQLAAMPGWMQQSVVVLAALTGGGLLAAAGIAKARQAIGQAVETLEGMGPAGAKAGRGLQSAARSAGILAAALVAVEVANTIGDQFKEALPPTNALASGLRDFANSGKAGGKAAQVFGGDLRRLHDDLDNVGSAGGFRKTLVEYDDWIGVLNVATDGLAGATERVTAFDAAMADLVARGRTEEAARVVASLGLSTAEAGRLLPTYTAALGDVEDAAADSATAQQKTSEAAKQVTATFQSAYAATHGLADAFDQLNGLALSADDALSKLEQAYDGATESIKTNGKTLNIHSEAGRSNRAALKDIARAAGEAMQAMQANGSTVDAVRGRYDEARKTFIDTAVKMGATRAEAIKLADTWLSMPTSVTTKVATPGLNSANANLNRVNRLLDEIDGKVSSAKVITEFYSYRHDEAASSRRWGGITTHAATGLLRDAAIYSAQSPARYAFAEPATRGEAFVPRNGDYGRSMSILSQAARWYGATVVPGGQQSAPSTPAISPEALGRAVRGALSGMTVVMDGRAVGELTGRDADRFRRGG